jgi:beta-glucanase (GH16 family)
MRTTRQWRKIAATGGTPTPQVSVPGNWTLKFQEEFDAPVSVAQQGSASPFIWTDHLWYVNDWHTDHNHWPSGDATVDLSTVFQVSNSILTINAHKLGDGTWVGSTLASVNSSGVGFSQQWGYFESKIKMSKGNGLWPAWWLYNVHRVTDGTAPAAEIDIMEFLGNTPDTYWATYHSYATGTHVQNGNNSQRDVGFDLTLDWHTFSVYWDSTAVTWYLDGAQQISNPTYSDQNTPMFLIINHALGGWNNNTPDATTPDPSPMLVDYIRVWGP